MWVCLGLRAAAVWVSGLFEERCSLCSLLCERKRQRQPWHAAVAPMGAVHVVGFGAVTVDGRRKAGLQPHQARTTHCCAYGHRWCMKKRPWCLGSAARCASPKGACELSFEISILASGRLWATLTTGPVHPAGCPLTSLACSQQPPASMRASQTRMNLLGSWALTFHTKPPFW